ncbi:MAG: UDP-N-acetylmuramoyl-L-alanyl-D-glutamate--2,6-diaminopimelate ligase [Methylohalobius sp.]|nr:UDP-N-acetylmuramoyl-L-alanyl-D-glutamate--2,6-diaminopimelate ligase [Methylohalobius sp.]
MKLNELLPGVLCPALEVGGLCDQSQAVRPGDVFFALAGTRCHGLEFIYDAQARGAIAVVYDLESEVNVPLNIPAIAVPQLKERLGEIAARFYGHPSRDIEVIGVTGTNGKTSCSLFLAQILKGGVLGTLGWGRPGVLQPSLHTTAPAIETQRRLNELRGQGIKVVVMEVSSHALEQGRVNGIDFRLALWTNLSRDHLDYHCTMEAYLEAKQKLFAWPTLEAAVLNLDDPAWPHFYQVVAPGVTVVGYGTKAHESLLFPRVTAAEVHYGAAGMRFEALWGQERAPVEVPLLGEFNLANVLAVLAVLLARGWQLVEAAEHLRTIQPVPGRMECFRAEGWPLVVVDYAHTPAGLESALNAVRRHVHGKVWVVFGCGGERDRGKRPLMGKIAEQLADYVILTDDNPRSEPGDRIIADIRAGMVSLPRIIRDRAEAIATAVTSASPEDVVLIAGKGHEDYQEIEGVRKPFSDRALVAELLNEAAICV